MDCRMSSKLRATFEDGTPVSHDLAEQELFKLLESGKATLNDRQDEPPWILLDIFEAGLDKVEKFGPETNDEASSVKISKGLVLSGVRQLSVEGRSIGWCRRKHGILNAAGQVLGSQPASKWNVWADAERILGAYLKKGHRRVSLRGRYSPETLVSHGWIRIGNGNLLDKTWEYLEVDPKWCRFNERKKLLAGQLEDTVRNALASGRIICCEDGSQGARVVPPSLFSRKWKSGKDCYYCFTRDLPKAWFSTSGQLRTRRRDAAKWMNETYLHFQSEGRTAGIGDLKTVAAKKFELTPNAVKDAWRDFNPKPSQPGNCPRLKRVTLKEIKDLINR